HRGVGTVDLVDARHRDLQLVPGTKHAHRFGRHKDLSLSVWTLDDTSTIALWMMTRQQEHGTVTSMGKPRWLDERQQRVWQGYLHLNQDLISVLEQQLARESGLSGADYRVLVPLSEAPDGLLPVRCANGHGRWGAVPGLSGGSPAPKEEPAAPAQERGGLGQGTRPSAGGGGGRSRLPAGRDRRYRRAPGLPGGARRRAGGGAAGSRRLWCRRRGSGGRRAQGAAHGTI